ncbi:hypothetical protein Lferr_1821 [Acidithiobacillus ferrooxidans ATCC 53993]|uniref:Uncharacterized protein n=1 Tax=Acidithiobacillus ferrooxidans (strain ATCC 23270 / DSM 14882 / CIP 104768 / NCIMB 8455) TaxID=243159 RepID=B7J5F0_ACIF2|nr:hypothetical protein Lferr_1821 [Acidithiobacillus ferrooxidans ATCC 53993]ACK78979.1 hypothetical protein AFE_2162 [Acidithiobacillus ferrooxidans ATCC 23270]
MKENKHYPLHQQNFNIPIDNIYCVKSNAVRLIKRRVK